MKKVIKKVAALKYNPKDTAPKIIAKGKGVLADHILEKGATHSIPTYEDSCLVETLLQLDIGQEIPPELYEIIAEILIFIQDLDTIKGK